MFKTASLFAAAVCLAGAGSVTAASLVSQNGILDLSANGGINPNTGAAWQLGDTYRLAFFTDGVAPGNSNSVAFYNDFVTTQAQLNPALVGTNWFAMVSVNLERDKTQADSAKSDVKVNTGTSDLSGGAGIGGAGSPVYVMDGQTAIARNNADIWNSWSNPFDGDDTRRIETIETPPQNPTINNDVFYSPFLNQFGAGDTGAVHGNTIATGVNNSGSIVNPLGVTTDNDTLNWGSSNANRTGRVWNRFTGSIDSNYRYYAISEVFEVQEANVIPSPTAALAGLIGLGGLMVRRRRG